MSPARAALEGPFSRSLREALESVASEAMVPRLVAMSLSAASRTVVPEDAAPFAAFVEGPLRTVIVQSLGIAAYEVVGERLAHVLAMATSQVRMREEREEDSQVRPTAPPREPSSSSDLSLDFGDLEFELPLPPPPRSVRPRGASAQSIPAAAIPPAAIPPASTDGPSSASKTFGMPSGSSPDVLGSPPGFARNEGSSSGTSVPRGLRPSTQTLGRIQAQRGQRGAIEEDVRGRAADPRTSDAYESGPRSSDARDSRPGEYFEGRTADSRDSRPGYSDARDSRPGYSDARDSRPGDARDSRPGYSYAPSRVLVITLDPLLIAETEGRLRGRSEVIAIGTSAELLAGVREASGRVAMVVDTALPSIDVPTFAALSSSFPPGAVVVLWGMSERQKQRLVTMFPMAEPWIASGVAASPVDLLVRG